MQGPLNPTKDFKISLMEAFLRASVRAVDIFKKCVDPDRKPSPERFGTSMFSADEVQYREMLVSFILQMRTSINSSHAFRSLTGNCVETFSLPKLSKDSEFYKVLKTDAIRLVNRINHDRKFCRELMYDFALTAQDLQHIRAVSIPKAANEDIRPLEPVACEAVPTANIS